MDDIYKAAVRDWGGWAYWGLTYLRIGGQGHPREVVGTQERTFTLSGQSLKGMVGLVFQGVKRVRDLGLLERSCRSGWRRRSHFLASCLPLSPSVCGPSHYLSVTSICTCLSDLWIFVFLSSFCFLVPSCP